MARPCWLFGAGIALALAVVPASARTESYLVGGPKLSFGSIELDVPDKWSALQQAKDSPSGQAIKFEPPGDKPFLLLISTLPLLKGAGPTGRCKDLRPLADQLRSKLLDVAEERKVPLRELRGSRACGFYASATDRTVDIPSLENFKYAPRDTR